MTLIKLYFILADVSSLLFSLQQKENTPQNYKLSLISQERSVSETHMQRL